MPVWELLKRYERSIQLEGRQERGVTTYINHLKAFFTSLPCATLDAITPETIADYQVEMAARCSGRTVGLALTVICSFCQWAIQNRLIEHDPSRFIIRPKRLQSLPRPLTRAQLKLLWVILKPLDEGDDNERWHHRRNRRAILLMLYAGLRLSEAAALRWSEVDVVGGSLMVLKGKGGKSRCLPLHPLLKQELLAMPYQQPQHAVAGTTEGKPLNPKSLAHIFERWLPDRGLKITAHQLRHTFATELLANGANIMTIRDLMGHTSVKTTEIYLLVSTERMRGELSLLPSSW